MVARCVFKDGSRIEKGSDDTAQTVRAELTPLFKDNVTEWLPLDSQCMFRFPLRLHQERSERTRVQRSYRNWLRYEGSSKGSDHPHPPERAASEPGRGWARRPAPAPSAYSAPRFSNRYVWGYRVGQPSGLESTASAAA